MEYAWRKQIFAKMNKTLMKDKNCPLFCVLAVALVEARAISVNIFVK